VPAVHVWLLAARKRPPSRALGTLAVLAALAPAALAVASSLGAVGAGPWDLLLMIADGHVSPLSLLAICPLVGSVLGMLVLMLRQDLTGSDLWSTPQRPWGQREADPASVSIDPNASLVDVSDEWEPSLQQHD
jgi:hypothetical protein